MYPSCRFGAEGGTTRHWCDDARGAFFVVYYVIILTNKTIK